MFVSLRSYCSTFSCNTLVDSNLPKHTSRGLLHWTTLGDGGFVLGPAPMQTTSSQVAWYLLFSSCLIQIRWTSAGFAFLPFAGFSLVGMCFNGND